MTLPSTLPAPRVPDAMSAPVLSWGILGTGWIADRFVQSLRHHTRQKVVAVGSRSSHTAASFARQHGIEGAHGSYEGLVDDPEVDVVYIASPHHLHVQYGVMAMEAGKHVLIEKPMALTVAGLERLFAAADRHGVMCQEAFWSFFLPKFDVIRQIIDDGWLGDLTTVIADHGEWLPPSHRIHDPSMAGGSLHDLGVYVLGLSAWAAGAPATTRATGIVTPTGVIGDVAVALTTSSGTVSSLSTTMLATTPCRAVLAGPAATLATTDAFFFPGTFTVTETASGRTLTWDEPNIRHGALYFEAAEVARRIAADETTTSAWTREHSRHVVAALQAINGELGLDPQDV